MVCMKIIFLVLLSVQASAAILFEGWSKISIAGVPAGYTVAKYEFDEKTKRFYATTFLNTGTLGSSVTESLKATADENLNPISYEYTAVVGKDVKTIDAKFKNGKMTALVSEKKGSAKAITKTISNDIAKGTFLSSFLVYIMLKSKSGLKSNESYSYVAVAEEDASITKGKADVGGEETKLGVRAFKVSNTFKDVKFTSWISERGEVLSTESPANNVATELMAKPADAIGTFSTSAMLLKKLFGEYPTGIENVISKNAKQAALAPPSTPGKKEGVPQGQGLMLKPGAKEK
jgi:hypothetical protein